MSRQLVVKRGSLSKPLLVKITGHLAIPRVEKSMMLSGSSNRESMARATKRYRAGDARGMSDPHQYRQDHRIVSLAMRQDFLCVDWDDGSESLFHYGWLIENCPQPSSRHANSRERLIQPLSIPEEIRPIKVLLEMSGDAVVVRDEPEAEDPTC